MAKPQPEELEIVLFGPGYGESVAFHLGGKWTIVDSCTYKNAKLPAPLEYLLERGVNPNEEVAWVIASHWHDDHIRGLGKVFEMCGSAKFGCPNALRSREFAELLGHYRQPTRLESTGLGEMNRVFAELEKRIKTGRNGQICWIGEGRLLDDREIQVSGRNVRAEIFAASPSDEAFQKGLIGIAERLPNTPHTGRTPPPIRRATTLDQNHTAIVLHVRAGDSAIVLGSDLETTKSNTDGWAQACSFLRTRSAAQVLKIPHHGSITAHHAGLWNEVVVENPIAILTPFVKGRVSLPTDEDIVRICGHTTRAFASCRPRSLEVKFRNRVVDRLLTDIATSPLISQAAAGGRIEISRDLRNEDAEWTIMLRDGAVQLTDLLNEDAHRGLRVTG